MTELIIILAIAYGTFMTALYVNLKNRYAILQGDTNNIAKWQADRIRKLQKENGNLKMVLKIRETQLEE